MHTPRPAVTLVGFALAAAIGIAATPPARAGVFAADPLGGAAQPSTDPGLQVQLREPPGPRLVAALFALALLTGWPRGQARPTAAAPLPTH
jgi:hypothetical protein